ncbi:MAG TPA: hypothetical protein VI278_00050 [Nitrososphaeraceae archaeon]
MTAKDLMASLKEAGYTNKEILILTGEKWSEPTVKLYTRGINTSKVITGFGNGIVFVNKLQHFCNIHHVHNTTDLLELVNIYGSLLDIKKK